MNWHKDHSTIDHLAKTMSVCSMLWVILRLTFALFSLLSVLIMLGAGFGAIFQSDVPQIAYESNPEGNWDIFLLDLNTHLTHNLTRHPAADTQTAWSEATGKIASVSPPTILRWLILMVFTPFLSGISMVGSSSCVGADFDLPLDLGFSSGNSGMTGGFSSTCPSASCA